MPINIMIVQGLIVSLMSTAFLVMPTISSSFWILNALTALLYLIMYMFMFASGIRLRYSKPHVQRHYRIAGGKTFGMWIVAGIGFLSSVFAFCIGFLPPSQIDTGETSHFVLFLGTAVAVLFILPLIFFACRKDHWKMDVLKDK